MSEKPKALLFDSNSTRSEAIATILTDLGWNIDSKYDIPCCKQGVLDNRCGYSLDRNVRLILIHQQNQSYETGDECTLEFVNMVIQPELSKQKLALIGYSGASAIEFGDVPELYRENSKCHLLLQVSGADSANFAAFAKAWAKDISQEPPFDLLRPDFPADVIAKYLQAKCNADTDSNKLTKLANDLDSHFHSVPQRVIRAAEFGLLAMSLRAKVSHSWLDHEVLSVSSHDLASRDSQRWQLIAGRWQTLHELALDFAEVLPQLSASSLVPRLFPDLPDDEKEKLINRLNALQADSIAGKKALYLDRLGAFWQAAQAFLNQASIGTSGDALVPEWEPVRSRAEALKQLFLDGTLPNGIEIP
jgi:hypothetical protein